MNEIYKRALECYIKKLEDDNSKLKLFAKEVNSIIYDFDSANPDKSYKERITEVRELIRMYEYIFKED